MRKKNPLMKISSGIFILTGIIELGGILLLGIMDGSVLSDLFETIFVESIQSKLLLVLIILVRVLIGIFCLMETHFDLCICLAFALVIKNFIFMYYFNITNIYMFLYRSVPEFVLVVVYMLGMIHFKYRET